MKRIVLTLIVSVISAQDCFQESKSFGNVQSSTDLVISDLPKLKTLQNPQDYFVHAIITCELDGVISG